MAASYSMEKRAQKKRSKEAKQESFLFIPSEETKKWSAGLQTSAVKDLVEGSRYTGPQAKNISS